MEYGTAASRTNEKIYKEHYKPFTPRGDYSGHDGRVGQQQQNYRANVGPYGPSSFIDDGYTPRDFGTY